MQQHNLSIRGGSDNIKYYGFFGFLDQPTAIRTNGGKYNRYNFRSNIDAKILDNLSLQLDVSSSLGLSRFAVQHMVGAESIWSHLYSTLPIYQTKLPDPAKLAWTGAGPVNGLTNREVGGYWDDDRQNIQGSVTLNYDFKFIKGLKAKAFFNYSQTSDDNKRFSKPYSSYTYNYKEDIYLLRSTINNNRLEQFSNKDKMITGQLSLNFDRTFARDHQISILALYEGIDNSGTSLSASRQSFLSSSIDYLFSGSESTQLNNGSAYEMGRASYVGRINYAYKSRYLLESTLRYDASAKFPPDSRWGIFPSVSLGWRLSEEKFIKNSIQALDNLKLRGSYSQTGNDAVGNFQYLTGYAFGKNYAIGDALQKGITDRGLANPFLTWEEMNTYNLGVDFSVWKRKLYGEFDGFYRHRNGIVATRYASLPSTFGATLPPENLNSSNDRGFEAMLGTSGSLKDLRWDISANISWTRSKWDHYEEPDYSDPDDIRIKKNSGRWVDRTYGYLSDGLFTSQEEIDNLGYNQDQQGNKTLRPGDMKFKDLNGDQIIDWRDQAEIGKGSFPHGIVGLNTSVSYRKFDCSLLFQGAFGYNNYITVMNSSKLFYDLRWTSENNNYSSAFIPRLGGSSLNNQTSDHWLKDVYYLRLKTLSVGYTVPERFIKKLQMTNARFYFAGTNLFTLSTVGKYGVDPESPSGTVLYYPQQRVLSFGFSVSF
jgi:TonB-linked SusC/RagA family outer membrane protein